MMTNQAMESVMNEAGVIKASDYQDAHDRLRRADALIAELNELSAEIGRDLIQIEAARKMGRMKNPRKGFGSPAVRAKAMETRQKNREAGNE